MPICREVINSAITKIPFPPSWELIANRSLFSSTLWMGFAYRSSQLPSCITLAHLCKHIPASPMSGFGSDVLWHSRAATADKANSTANYKSGTTFLLCFHSKQVIWQGRWSPLDTCWDRYYYLGRLLASVEKFFLRKTASVPRKKKTRESNTEWRKRKKCSGARRRVLSKQPTYIFLARKKLWRFPGLRSSTWILLSVLIQFDNSPLISRPKTVDDVTHQDEVVATLKKSLETGNVCSVAKIFER